MKQLSFEETQKPDSPQFPEEKAERDVVGVYPVMKAAEKVNGELFINSHRARTKARSMKLVGDWLNKDKSKLLITQQTVDFWNLLPNS